MALDTGVLGEASGVCGEVVSLISPSSQAKREEAATQSACWVSPQNPRAQRLMWDVQLREALVRPWEWPSLWRRPVSITGKELARSTILGHLKGVLPHMTLARGAGTITSQRRPRGPL